MRQTTTRRLLKSGSLQPLWTQQPGLDAAKGKKKPKDRAAPSPGAEASKKLRLSKQKHSQFLKKHQQFAAKYTKFFKKQHDLVFPNTPLQPAMAQTAPSSFRGPLPEYSTQQPSASPTLALVEDPLLDIQKQGAHVQLSYQAGPASSMMESIVEEGRSLSGPDIDFMHPLAMR